MASDIQVIRTAEDEDESKDELQSLLAQIHHHSKLTKDLFKTLLSDLTTGEDFKDGVSFLDVKNDSLISYMIEVCNIILNKVKCKSINGNPSVERSVELRITLEKIKTIDQRLSYQINKLISTTSSDAPTDHRINLANIEVDDELEDNKNVEAISDREPEDDDEEEGSDGDKVDDYDDISDDSADIVPKLPKARAQSDKVQSTESTGRVYRPPKLKSMAYEEDERIVESDRMDRKNRKRNLNKILMEDLQREMDDMPMEIEDRTEKVDKERLQYEEDNFVRLQAPSKKRKANKSKNEPKRKKYRPGRGGHMGGRRGGKGR